MRLLGIDYGALRIGIAISDEEEVLAFPLVVYPNDKSVVGKLKKLKKEEKFGAVVVGESRNFQQKENPIMERVHRFSDVIKKELNVHVYLEPEFLTTVEAKYLGKPGMTDASAAAIILQSYLDKKKNKHD